MLFLDTGIVPKAVSDPQIFYEAVFKYHMIFQENLQVWNLITKLD